MPPPPGHPAQDAALLFAQGLSEIQPTQEAPQTGQGAVETVALLFLVSFRVHGENYSMPSARFLPSAQILEHVFDGLPQVVRAAGIQQPVVLLDVVERVLHLVIGARHD